MQSLIKEKKVFPKQNLSFKTESCFYGLTVLLIRNFRVKFRIVFCQVRIVCQVLCCEKNVLRGSKHPQIVQLFHFIFIARTDSYLTCFSAPFMFVQLVDIFNWVIQLFCFSFLVVSTVLFLFSCCFQLFCFSFLDVFNSSASLFLLFSTLLLLFFVISTLSNNLWTCYVLIISHSLFLLHLRFRLSTLSLFVFCFKS